MRYFPFCTIDPNVGIVNLPDKRLNKIAEIVDPEEIIQSTVEFDDIAGLVEGASNGEGLGNKFLANIRETDAIIHVVRCFEDESIIHVKEKIYPLVDIKTIKEFYQKAENKQITVNLIDTKKNFYYQKPLCFHSMPCRFRSTFQLKALVRENFFLKKLNFPS